MNPNENEPTPPLTDEEREHRRVRYAQYWASKRVADEFAGAILMPESKVEEFRFVGKDPALTSSPQLKPGDSLPHGKDLPVETCSPPTEVSLRRFEGPRRRVPPVRRIGCFWRR